MFYFLVIFVPSKIKFQITNKNCIIMALRILHLSDFHYKDLHDADFIAVGKKIAESIKDIQIDLVVFSGDLVFDTKDTKILDKAAKCFIEPIQNVTGLDNSRFLIAPGNHDMLRDSEKPMVREILEKYKTSSQVNSFCSHPGQLADSLENFVNYKKFITDFYANSMTIEPLYTYSICEINNNRIGLIAFNSAWRCKESIKDRGKLLYPVYMIQEAFEKVKDCDFVICAQHHNISDFADYVAQDIENEINEHCHVLLTGHYHKGSVQTTHDTEIGLLHLAAPATYNRNDKESMYGFNILEIDETTFEGYLFTYTKYEDKFIEIAKKPVAIPVSEEKQKLNNFRKLLHKRYDETLEKADALFVAGKNGSFVKLFKDPIIKNKSVQEIITTKREGQQFRLDDIICQEKSTIIFGYNKRGKSSLLRWIQLKMLKSCVTNKTIPFFLDSKHYRNGKEFNLEKLLHGYLEINHKAVTERLNEYKLLLLIDDLNPNDSRFMDNLKREMAKFPKTRFIATMPESMSRQCALINFEGTDVDKYYIHDITNKEIHQLTLSWPNITSDNKKIVEEKIIQIFTQMHISLNYWTTSLFLWLFEKTDPRNIHNNFELVKLYIDELLGMEKFINNDNFKTEYSDLKSYLAALAEKMLYSNDYALEEKELVCFTEEYRENNIKFSDSTLDIINYLMESGTIHKIEGKYSIRLKGVFEFLLAYRMTENDALLNCILTNKYAFMSFGNELEYYAGFKKKDFKTIEIIFNSAKEILKPFTLQDNYNSIDERLEQKVLVTQQDVQCTGKLIERLNEISDEEQCDLLPTLTGTIDETELKVKTMYQNVPINPTNVEHILFILSRVYRNSNVCDDKTLANEMLNYILTGTCNLGFLLVDEAKTYELKGDENAEALVNLVSNFMPIIIETFFYDAICQKNLVRVFTAKLNELLQNPEGNQLRIFIITYILVDLDIREHFDLINKSLKMINNKVLRYAALNKNILLTVKNYENSGLRKMLKEQRQELIKEFDKLDNLNSEIDFKLLHQQNKETHQKHNLDKDYK